MENNKGLTLEEIAQLVEKMDKWYSFSKDSYNGYLEDKYQKVNIHCAKIGLISKSKKTRVTVYVTNKKERGSLYDIGEMSGTQVYPIYQKIKELCENSLERQTQEQENKEREWLQKIRESYILEHHK
ncbi:MAG: hypothetical protein PHE43_02140 [Candidatus Nanoarchaeia archaeon]|nr:hypothetical protein [Candidatus Nanoarchaeia archaeon]